MKQIPDALRWLTQQGLSEGELGDLNPCVPGEFTMQHTYYVNTGSPGVVYRGSEEGTLPMVGGRWYLLPQSVIRRHAQLTRDAQPVARAVRLTR